MANLTAERMVPTSGGDIRRLLLKLNTPCFKGEILGLDIATGFVRRLVAGDKFAGIAEETIKAEHWAHFPSPANGDVTVRARTGLFDAVLPFSGAAQSDAGTVLFASDSVTVTETGDSETNSKIGVGVGLAGTNELKIACATFHVADAVAPAPAPES